MALTTLVSFQKFLAICKGEFDTIIEKMEHWEGQVGKMSESVKSIWISEKNLLGHKIQSFDSEYKRLVGLLGTNLTEMELIQFRHRIHQDLSSLKENYYRSTSILRSAERKDK